MIKHLLTLRRFILNSAALLVLVSGFTAQSPAADMTNFEQTLRAYMDRGGTAFWANAGDDTYPGVRPADGYYAQHANGANLAGPYNQAVSVMRQYIEGMTIGLHTDSDLLDNISDNAYSNGSLGNPPLHTDPNWKTLYAALGGAPYFAALANKTTLEQYQQIQMILRRMDDCYQIGVGSISLVNGQNSVTCAVTVDSPSTWGSGVASIQNVKTYHLLAGQVAGFPTPVDNQAYYRLGGFIQTFVFPPPVNGVEQGRWIGEKTIQKIAYKNNPPGTSRSAHCDGASLHSAHYSWSLGNSLFGNRSGF